MARTSGLPRVNLAVTLLIASALAGAWLAHGIPTVAKAALVSALVVLSVASPFAGLCALAFLVPIEDALLAYGQATILKVLGPALFLGWATRVLTQMHGKLARPDGVVMALVGFSVWGAASILWSQDQYAAVEYAVTMLLLSAFLFLVPQLVEDFRDLRSLVSSYVAGTVLSGAMALYNLFTIGLPAGRRVTALMNIQAGTYIQNAGHYGISLAPGVFFFVAGSLFSGSARTRLLSIIATMGLLEAALASGTRSFMVSFAVACLVLGWYLWHRKLRSKTTGLVLLGLLLVTIAGWTLPQFVIDRAVSVVITMGDRGTGRLDIWKVFLVEVAENPVVGVGVANGPLRYDEYRDKAVEQYGANLPHGAAWSSGRDAHNIYLQTLAEMGLVGFIFLAGSLVAMGSRMYKSLNGHVVGSAEWQLGLVIGLNFLALVVTGMSEPSLVRKYLWLGWALVVTYSRLSEKAFRSRGFALGYCSSKVRDVGMRTIKGPDAGGRIVT